jgi:hypothetical protein
MIRIRKSGEKGLRADCCGLDGRFLSRSGEVSLKRHNFQEIEHTAAGLAAVF